MFCIFIGVTFANLGREGWKRARCETRFAIAQKRTAIKIKCTDLSQASASRKTNMSMKQIIYDNT